MNGYLADNGGSWRRDLLIGIIKATVVLGLTACAVLLAKAPPEQWPTGQALLASTWAVVVLAVAMCVVGLVFFVRYVNPGDDDGQASLFMGVVCSCAGVLGLAALASILRPGSVASSPAPPQVRVLRVVGDDTNTVRFPGEDGRRGGPDIYRRNALAAAIRGICVNLNNEARGLSRSGKPDLWTLVRHLFDYRPPPEPACVTQRVEFELCFYDGNGAEDPVRCDDLVAELDRRLMESSSSPRPVGLPRSLASCLSQRGGETGPFSVLLIGTGEVDSLAEADQWRQWVGADSDDKSGRVAILLPSLPRSGWAKLRGSAAKADMLGSAVAKVFSLDPTASQLPGQPKWASIFPADDLAAADRDAWDQPRDLEALRRFRFGPEQAARVDAGLQAFTASESWSELLADLGLVTTPPTSAVSRSSHFAWLLALGALPVLFVLFWRVPRLTLLLEVGARIPPGQQRIALLLGTLSAGAILTGVSVWWLWPGAEWQLQGLPAVAAWGFLAAWSGLVVWPILYQTRMLYNYLPNWRHDALPAAGLTTLWAIVPALGLSGYTVLGLLMLLALLIAGSVVVCWPQSEAGQGDLAEQKWARPLRWCPAAAAGAVWLAVFLTGFASRPGNPADRRVAVASMLLAGLAMALLGSARWWWRRARQAPGMSALPSR